MNVRKRAAAFSGCLGFLFTLLADDAAASLDVGVTVAELSRWSSAVAIVTVLESHSAWEGTRIVTLSRVHVDRLVAGTTSTAEPVIRTLGGTVGRLTQVVEGEAELAPGSRSMIFLRESTDGTAFVTARAQGQFLLAEDRASRPVLSRSPHLGELVDRRGVAHSQTAVFELHLMPLESAERAIHVVWEKTHAP
jgi:hypothetical protein